MQDTHHPDGVFMDATRIMHESVRDHVKRTIQSAYELSPERCVRGARGDVTLPAPQPVSLHSGADAERVARGLVTGAYSIGIKADGFRCLLVFTSVVPTTGGPVTHLCVSVDRAMQMHMHRVTAPAWLWMGPSVFDCEVMRPSAADVPVFLVFDAVVIRGLSIFTETYSARFEAVRRILRMIDKGDPLATITLVRKEMIRPDDVGRQGHPYPHDGYIFTPMRVPGRVGRQSDLFRVKGTETIDVYVDPWGLPVIPSTDDGESGGGTRLQLVEPPPAEGVYEFHVAWERDGVLGLVNPHLRTDKTQGNNARTIDACAAAVRANITVERIIEMYHRYANHL